MIQQPFNVRPEFLDKIKNFCSINNIEYGVVYSESWLHGASGTPEQVNIVEKYINKLEHEREEFRKNKSFWWRMWN